MITYIITSITLSLASWAIYLLFVRRKASLVQQKTFIYLSLAGSLLLPLTVSHKPLIHPNPLVQPLAFGQIDHGHLQQFCQCEKPDYSHRVLYRTNAYYNILLKNKHWLSGIIFSAVFLTACVFLAQLIFLNFLVNSSPKEFKRLGKHGFYLLYPSRKLGVGAFHLRKKYIIWQAEMEHLSEQERQAVFAHELSHIQQQNTLEKAMLSIIQCFWLINPAFYFFRKELDLLSECIADRKGSEIMESRKEYARLLLKLKTLQPVALVQHFKGGILQKRIEILLAKSDSSSLLPLLSGFLLLTLFQLNMVNPVSASVSRTIYELETYETIYRKVAPGRQQAIYCQDCETICSPEPPIIFSPADLE